MGVIVSGNHHGAHAIARRSIQNMNYYAVPAEQNQPEMVVAQPKIVQAEPVSSEAPSAAPAQAVSAPEK